MKNKDPKNFINKMDKLIQLKKRADQAYFNTDCPIMDDGEYDALVQTLKTEYNYVDQESVGAHPTHNKAQLPVWMGSLTKHTTSKEIANFLNKLLMIERFSVQEKLDGISCLFVQDETGRTKLYTRGNGSTGSDISHLLACGIQIPRIKEKVMVRGELVMSRKTFETKYSSQFSNPRNLVSGLVCAKQQQRDNSLSDIKFIAYELISSTEIQMPVSEQLVRLGELGFEVVYHRSLKRKYIFNECLMDYLTRRKRKSIYQIDGLVIVCDDMKYVRNVADNPKYAFAFKNRAENVAEAVVEKVVWNLSKSGRYKPQICIVPVVLDSVTISRATGHNAKFVVDNKIGRGAKLLITRSGNVIPHVLSVLEHSTEPLSLPANSQWVSVDLCHVGEGETPDEVVIKQMVHFCKKINAVNCKEKTISKIYNAGFKTIEAIVSATAQDLQKIGSIGQTLAQKLVDSIQKGVRESTTKELLAALNAFGDGIGLRKIANLDLSDPRKETKGLSRQTVDAKIIPVLGAQLARVNNLKTLAGCASTAEQPALKKTGADKIFVFTGFRDPSLEKQIATRLGKVNTSISKKTHTLVVDDKALSKPPSSKMLKAQSLGINVITRKQLCDLLDQTLAGLSCEFENEYASSDEEC
ncbi:NAD-dependent DNA ligase [Chloriridovirus anopheles1]|uniref:DNA ligase (NAD(+)) n=1 Tax=Chloriridovirus anopheles1 TaxID=1465751 RepID=W8QF60_9VIRU|nr:NAD-dependent DNA ligase [Anopheles minimus iridovirus]AHL67609.1 DNA ligase [Anopheles minimus iridovirus]